MPRPLLNFLLPLILATLAQAQDAASAPRQIGDLLVTLTSATAPSTLLEDRNRLDPPPDRYWVVLEITFRNEGNLAVCATFSSALRAEQGLAGRASPLSGPGLSDLHPGEEVQARFIFTVPRGANPLELILKTMDYGRDCGDKLPPAAADSVRIPIRGVSSPAPAPPAP